MPKASVHSELKPCSRQLAYKAVDEDRTTLEEQAKNCVIKSLPEDPNKEMT